LSKERQHEPDLVRDGVTTFDELARLRLSKA